MVESEWLMGQQMGTWLPWPYIWHSVMAWAIVCWPSCIVKGSVARYAGLPTQVPTPVSVNTVSLTVSKVRPSPNDCLP